VFAQSQAVEQTALIREKEEALRSSQERHKSDVAKLQEDLGAVCYFSSWEMTPSHLLPTKDRPSFSFSQATFQNTAASFLIQILSLFITCSPLSSRTPGVLFKRKEGHQSIR